MLFNSLFFVCVFAPLTYLLRRRAGNAWAAAWWAFVSVLFYVLIGTGRPTATSGWLRPWLNGCPT